MQSSPRIASSVAVAILGLFLMAPVPTRLGQDVESRSQTDLRDLTDKKKALMNDLTDFETMAKSLQGTEFDTVMQFDQKAEQAVMHLDATIWFLAVYDKMQCEPDRAVAKAALKNRLGFYSHLLDILAEQTTGYLVFAKLPATAQAGSRTRDELRAAKNKLDAIASSLE